jgi:hypothetical protein
VLSCFSYRHQHPAGGWGELGCKRTHSPLTRWPCWNRWCLPMMKCWQWGWHWRCWSPWQTQTADNNEDGEGKAQA